VQLIDDDLSISLTIPCLFISNEYDADFVVVPAALEVAQNVARAFRPGGVGSKKANSGVRKEERLA